LAACSEICTREGVVNAREMRAQAGSLGQPLEEGEIAALLDIAPRRDRQHSGAIGQMREYDLQIALGRPLAFKLRS